MATAAPPRHGEHEDQQQRKEREEEVAVKRVPRRCRRADGDGVRHEHPDDERDDQRDDGQPCRDVQDVVMLHAAPAFGEHLFALWRGLALGRFVDGKLLAHADSVFCHGKPP